MERDIKQLYEIAATIRKDIFTTICNGGGGHLASSFSIVEILTAIYFGNILNYDCKSPCDPDRDRFILSKGHGAVALYSILCRAGYFDKSVLNTYCKGQSKLGGLANMQTCLGVEASTGTLGHGFGFAGGIAWTGKTDEKKYRVITLLGDGECQEGSIWEGAMFASQNKLGNLTAIVDYNKLQAMDNIDNIVGMEPFTSKWESFGWEVAEVDGHSIEQLLNELKKPYQADGKPKVIIAHTTKGKGVSYMENSPAWHYRLPDSEEMKVAIEELNIEENEVMIK